MFAKFCMSSRHGIVILINLGIAIPSLQCILEESAAGLSFGYDHASETANLSTSNVAHDDFAKTYFADLLRALLVYPAGVVLADKDAAVLPPPLGKAAVRLTLHRPESAIHKCQACGNVVPRVWSREQ